jgi:hypothetical protein
MGIQNKDTKAIARLNIAQHLIFFIGWAIIVLGVLVLGQSNPLGWAEEAFPVKGEKPIIDLHRIELFYGRLIFITLCPSLLLFLTSLSLGLSLIFWSLLDKILNRKPILTTKILKFIIFLLIVGLLCASFSLPKSMRPLFNEVKEVEKALFQKGIIASSLKPIMPFGLKDIALAIIGGLLILFISDLLVYLIRKRRCSIRDFCLYGPILCSLFKDEKSNPSLRR